MQLLIINGNIKSTAKVFVNLKAVSTKIRGSHNTLFLRYKSTIVNTLYHILQT